MAVIETLVGRRSRYRTAWAASVSVLMAIGVASALVFIRMSGNVIVLAMVGAMYASIHFSVGLSQDQTPRSLLVPVLTWSLRAALAALAVCGYAAAVGPLVLLLLLVIAGTSPHALTYLSEPQVKSLEPAVDVAPPVVSVVPVAQPVPPTDFSELPVEELCLMWRHSFASLQRSPTDDVRLAVVSARDRVLDELERRDPQAFAEWLDSGPRAAGDPTRYFTHQADRGHRPDPGPS
ncbi:hypothetical protein OHA18_41200 [Kribbella sp. NBC_00709]|uniref:hypothetical protein n=1 Tax=Kribbella sp. NBC_00709 TaxID=2975972 RepID=UPI002E281495|nr:hypothetical protein [Kribbella sp. NBC_00709]